MKASKRAIKAADLFCGAGGTSTGLSLACAELGLSLSLIAVNHWQTAIETHHANHPEQTSLCANLDTVDPRKLVTDGKLDLLVASPECTHHSRARGGKPKQDQSRASAWRVIEWASQINIRRILVENVKEFREWGPLGVNGQPLKTRKGETFLAWVSALRSHGYTVEWRVLNAADVGEGTTRERLFVQAVKGREAIRWPERTHAPARYTEKLPLFAESKPLARYRPMKEFKESRPPEPTHSAPTGLRSFLAFAAPFPVRDRA